jgi:hypothetical protein
VNTCGHCGGWQLARRKPPAQPRSVFGSPEDIVERGTDTLAVQTERLGVAIAKAVHGLTSAKAINAAIRKTGKAWNRSRLALPLQVELTHGAMLGALDADFEARMNRPVKVESFAALHAPILLAPYDKSTDPAFATRPVKDAREQFERREAVTREVYDAMSDAARRRAVTVAGAATAEVVRTVQREVVRQVSEGADLRDFSKRVVPRLEAAGWTPQNDSHVENVLRTNVGSAYNAGRARQMMQPAVLRFRPYWQIVTVNDGPPRQRATHQAAHLVVLRADDPFWLTAYPPFGYQCRCRVRSLSQREGEPLAVGGKYLHDLPDRGFTSGLSQLELPPPELPPHLPPANDPGPAPANDTVPPKPRKPRAPRKPKQPPSVAEAYERHGVPQPAVAGDVPAAMQRATLRGFEKAGLGRGSKAAPHGDIPQLVQVEITSKAVSREAFRHANIENALPQNCGGVYWPSARQVRVGTDHDAHIWGFLQKRSIAEFEPKVAGKLAIPGNTQNIAQSAEQVVEMTACHEYGHHIHMSKLAPRYRASEQPDPNDEADVAIHREFTRSDREPVSYYGVTDRYEFFAEALTAYRYYDRAWMAKQTPRTLRLVRKVLKLRGLK